MDIQTDEAAQFVKQKEAEAIRGSYGTDGTGVTVENQLIIPQTIQEIPQQLQEIEKLENKYENFQLVGWGLSESNYQQKVESYLGKLDHGQRSSFAPIHKLISDSMDGLDLHILVLKDTQDIQLDNDAHIRGLVIFNQESQSAKMPNGRAAVKILLHHVSTIDP